MNDVTRPDDARPARRGLTRRDTLRAGGVALVGAGVLAACSSDDDPVAVTGTTGPEATTTTVVPPEDDDMVFLRTAASLELTAAGFYEQVLGIEDREIGPDLREVAVLFQAHHEQHAALLDRLITEAGGEVVEDTNEVYDAELVTTPLESATTDEAVLQAALALEELAAGAYVAGGASLTRPDLREKALQIGSSDTRHETYLSILLEDTDLVPEAFAPSVPFEAAAELPPGERTAPDEDGEEPEDGDAAE